MFYCTNSFSALEVITAAEKQSLNKIEHQYDIDILLITLNDNFSPFNRKVDDIDVRKKAIILERQRYNEFIALLPKVIRTNTAIAETDKKIEKSVSLIDELTQKPQQDGKHLETEKVLILTEYEAINKKRATKSQPLVNSKKILLII
ncbi:hypothetical protein [Shewanella psychromarinicola]|uniref:Uncharacterized protein n=1 Tax=Shewanella psychromarinicola TaxID=2487742 RepID=A0A3N4EN95_9GAMM|nr:hypothetical protein [Shewanella psychromarinicola]AZG37146.1 hypothetical protein EGC80_21270 [Shewanella psychromarinicola]MCL1083194.1 hypothetical protein [Shewanella psychromarinicola]RPA35001.1 hypothetical protein EGC77_04945 [Shewanella psychromarinicola]